jgi:hypothetical protein
MTFLNALQMGADMSSLNRYALPADASSPSLIEQYQRSLEMRTGQLVSVGKTNIIGAGIECASIIASQITASRHRELRHTPTRGTVAHARQEEAADG